VRRFSLHDGLCEVFSSLGTSILRLRHLKHRATILTRSELPVYYPDKTRRFLILPGKEQTLGHCLHSLLQAAMEPLVPPPVPGVSWLCGRTILMGRPDNEQVPNSDRTETNRRSNAGSARHDLFAGEDRKLAGLRYRSRLRPVRSRREKGIQRLRGVAESPRDPTSEKALSTETTAGGCQERAPQAP
jgi:hypothetical protein